MSKSLEKAPVQISIQLRHCIGYLLLAQLCEVIFFKFSEKTYTQLSLLAKLISISITPVFKKRFRNLVLVMIVLEISLFMTGLWFDLNTVFFFEGRVYQELL